MNGVPLGDHARRYRRPLGSDAATVFASLRAMPDVVDVLVTEDHVAVVFTPRRLTDATSAKSADDEVMATLSRLPRVDAPPSNEPAATVRVVHVRYEGPDLDECAARLALARADLIALHTGALYEIKLFGFLPGFAYLGDLDPRLVLPRRETPRKRVAAGSVAIAEAYTAVYPFASPGGWHLLGTALDFEAFAWTLGDRVRFEAV